MTHDEFHAGCGCSFCEAHAQAVGRASMRPAAPLRAFQCSHAKYPAWGHSVFNCLSASAAKVRYFHALREVYPEVAFTDLRVRQAGAPVSSEDFIRCATRRGLPGLRCGDVVLSEGARALVVGHNSSANFDLLFLEGRHAGLTLNVHPSGFSTTEIPSLAA